MNIYTVYFVTGYKKIVALIASGVPEVLLIMDNNKTKLRKANVVPCMCTWAIMMIHQYPTNFPSSATIKKDVYSGSLCSASSVSDHLLSLSLLSLSPPPSTGIYKPTPFSNGICFSLSLSLSLSHVAFFILSDLTYKYSELIYISYCLNLSLMKVTRAHQHLSIFQPHA